MPVTFNSTKARGKGCPDDLEQTLVSVHHILDEASGECFHQKPL